MNKQSRPQLASTYVVALFGLALMAVAIIAYYMIALQIGSFSAQTFTMESAGYIIVPLSMLCIFGVIAAMRVQVVSFPVIFIGSTFMFNLGRFVYLILEDITMQWPIKSVPTHYMIAAVPIVGVAFPTFLLGVIIARLRQEKTRMTITDQPKQTRSVITQNLETDLLRHIGYALYFIAMGLTVYYTLRGTGLAYAIRDGYSSTAGRGYASAAISGEIPLLATAAMYWFAPWAAMIVLATSQGRIERFFTIGLAVGACVPALIAGDRFVPVAIITAMMSTLHLKGYSFKLWQMAILGATMYFVVTAWAGIRVTAVRDWDAELFEEAVTGATTGEVRNVRNERVIHKYAFSRIFKETGTSFVTAPGTIKLIDEGEPFHYGIDYIRTLAVAVPLVAEQVGKWRPSPSEWFDDQYLNKNALQGLGFSLISEAYLQLGVVGVIIVHFLLGFGLTTIWHRLEERPDPNLLAFTMIVVTAMYIWVREDAGEVSRPLVWGGILTLVIPMLLAHGIRQSQQNQPTS